MLALRFDYNKNICTALCFSLIGVVNFLPIILMSDTFKNAYKLQITQLMSQTEKKYVQTVLDGKRLCADFPVFLDVSSL